MKILALYATDTLSLQRRVKIPFSALSKQGHSFSFLQVPSFAAGIGFSADVTVLQNWLLSEEELDELARVVQTRLFVMDCSDPLLLQEDLYRRALSMAQLVTVPSERFRREVRHLNSNIGILPSCMNKEHFFAARNTKLPKPTPTVIGCLGPYDWYLVADTLLKIKEAHPKVILLAGQEAARILGDACIPATFRPIGVPDIIHRTTFGLCPYDGEQSWDEIWEWEYGILCKPTITMSPPRSLDPTNWEKAIHTLLKDKTARAQAGIEAYAHANVRRDSRVAHLYRDTYTKKLPHLLRA